jgi:protein-tyrosine-phosphatase
MNMVSASKQEKLVMLYNRRSLTFILAASSFAHAIPAWAAKPCRITKVLFVCQMGSVKSAIAREQLRRIIKERSLPVEVQSRGLTPANDVTPELAARLKAEGINPAADPLRRFAPADAARAGVAIAFDDAAKAPGLERARLWHSPSWTDDYVHAKTIMDWHIGEFADELSRHPCS